MDAQIQFKLMKEDKNRIREIAKSTGLDISSFVRSAALEKVKKVLRENKEENS